MEIIILHLNLVMPKLHNKSNKSIEQDDQIQMSDAPLHTSLMQTLKDVLNCVHLKTNY